MGVLFCECSWTFHLQIKLQSSLAAKIECKVQEKLCLCINHNSLFPKRVEYYSKDVVNTTK